MNVTKLRNVANILLIILQKTVCFYLIQFLKSFNFNWILNENFNFSGWSNLFIYISLLQWTGSHFRAYNRRLSKRITLKIGENVTKSLYISLSIWKKIVQSHYFAYNSNRFRFNFLSLPTLPTLRPIPFIPPSVRPVLG